MKFSSVLNVFRLSKNRPRTEQASTSKSDSFTDSDAKEPSASLASSTISTCASESTFTSSSTVASGSEVTELRRRYRQNSRTRRCTPAAYIRKQKLREQIIDERLEERLQREKALAQHYDKLFHTMTRSDHH
ncbi:hypothetical protein QR680_013551 [Steinernema hermaphroditum]|uniref:Uncharacterized protein n=1 Tax=Steinernema hermaphroditum TaxID=289476 RepID=A0AA39M2Q2_9BILA|nr:hypothetical protein QR680_013551 [Steinernema hermaphroditum]